MKYNKMWWMSFSASLMVSAALLPVSSMAQLPELPELPPLPGFEDPAAPKQPPALPAPSAVEKKADDKKDKAKEVVKEPKKEEAVAPKLPALPAAETPKVPAPPAPASEVKKEAEAAPKLPELPAPPALPAAETPKVPAPPAPAPEVKKEAEAAPKLPELPAPPALPAADAKKDVPAEVKQEEAKKDEVKKEEAATTKTPAPAALPEIDLPTVAVPETKVETPAPEAKTEAAKDSAALPADKAEEKPVVKKKKKKKKKKPASSVPAQPVTSDISDMYSRPKLPPVQGRTAGFCSLTPSIAVERAPAFKKVVTNNRAARPAGKPDFAMGELLQISGHVYGENCVPLRNAKIDIWQKDDVGAYQRPTSEQLATPYPLFAGSARAVANNLGAYQFVTIFPNILGDDAPYINVRVSHPRLKKPFVTRMYFADDARNETVVALNKMPLEKRALLEATLEPWAAPDGKKGRKAIFDITLKAVDPYAKY